MAHCQNVRTKIERTNDEQTNERRRSRVDSSLVYDSEMKPVAQLGTVVSCCIAVCADGPLLQFTTQRVVPVSQTLALSAERRLRLATRSPPHLSLLPQVSHGLVPSRPLPVMAASRYGNFPLWLLPVMAASRYGCFPL